MHSKLKFLLVHHPQLTLLAIDKGYTQLGLGYQHRGLRYVGCTPASNPHRVLLVD